MNYYSTKFRTIEIVYSIYKLLNKRRKIQIFLLIILNFFSSIAESISVISVIPLLSFLSRSDLNYNLFFINNFINNESSLLIVISIFIFFILVTQILKILNLLFNQKVASLVAIDFSKTAYKNIINRNYVYFIESSSSSIINSLAANIEAFVLGFRSILNGITFLLISIFLIITSFAVNAKLTSILFLLLISSYIIIGKIISNKVLKNSKRIVNLTNNIIKIIQESFGQIRDIILNNSYNFYIQNYGEIEKERKFKQAENFFLSYFPKYIVETIGILVLALFALISFEDNQSNQTISTIGAFALAMQRLLPSAQIIYSSWIGIRANYSAMKNIIDINKKSSNNLFIDKIKTLKFEKKLNLRNISFSYKENNIYLLKDINLEINKGDFIGIFGKTGEGKSTLIDIITGILIPKEGDLLIDDVSVLQTRKKANLLNSWRKNIAYVPQEIFISEGDILENITLGCTDKNIDFMKIKECIDVTQINNFIEKLPMGLQSITGENGIKLSGGQRQRIGIARALYKNKSILILDEATSGIDLDTEEKLFKSLIKYKKNITLIMISHRKKSLQFCNKKFFLEKGSLKEII